MTAPLLKVTGVVKRFGKGPGVFSRDRQPVRAVNGVDLEIAAGETLGLVGESGCGKSTLGRIVTGQTTPTSGTVEYEGLDISTNPPKGGSGVQMIFQDPYGSLNPRMTVRSIVGEPLVLSRYGSAARRAERVDELLGLVGLPVTFGERYPHEMSGGQRQRTAIARALALNPRLIVCDEPVSALDVSIQAQILNLLKDLQEKMGVSYLFIAHGIQAVNYVSGRIAVMYLGEIMELGPADQVFRDPLHPYTEALRSAIPHADPHKRDRERIILSGDLPSAKNVPRGCPFATRCPKVMAHCADIKPAMTVRDGRTVACLLYEPNLGRPEGATAPPHETDQEVESRMEQR
ncbi:ABC transporter ATP-binding protein [Ornithinimicrobium cryptoxanthini]|uniref:ABC transporter ATP-binding protein n=1 Tax=Ornithinimicrobium cryptoxanthini TaxID=2934161 RepID=UPI002117E6FE|nr:ABC transporter ATP-binding protein [Ornithinimicrobium cryptoxanthini]